MQVWPIRIPEPMLERLRRKAKRDGRPASELLREYVARGLREDEVAENVIQGRVGHDWEAPL